MADQKITQLTATTNPAGVDVLPIVVDPAGTPATRKVTKDDLGIPRRVRLTSNTASNTTVTLSTVTGLALPVEAGNFYQFKFFVLHSSTVTTTGIVLALEVPANNTFGAVIDVSQSTNNAIAIIRGHVTTSNQSVTGLGTPVITRSMSVIEGFINPTANGNVQVRWASEVSGQGVTVLAGSNGLLWKLI